MAKWERETGLWMIGKPLSRMRITLESVRALAGVCDEVRRSWVHQFCSVEALARRMVAEACSGVGGQRWRAQEWVKGDWHGR